MNDGIEALAYLRRQGVYANSVQPDLILLDLDSRAGVVANLPRDCGLRFRRCRGRRAERASRDFQPPQKLVAESEPAMRPFDQPGISASVPRRYSETSTTPMIGCSVVNGCGATFGRAAEILRSNVDLPAFG